VAYLNAFLRDKVCKLLRLDVGCGHVPRGDVNVDLFVEATGHRVDKTRPLDIRNIPNFVKADACHLPFRDNVFDEVISYHTIEHVLNPVLMIKEMIRTCKTHGAWNNRNNMSACLCSKGPISHSPFNSFMV
jgi:ubiquinone/menaquinone biosynthesis C-methylase UbiE